MALDLHKGTRPDPYERYHLQVGQPLFRVWRSWFGIVKHVTWSHLFLEDGRPGAFESWWVVGNAVHWYKGNVKCDGTRTRMYWGGELDNGLFPTYTPDTNKYVMTTTPKEKFSVRFFVDPAEPRWDVMGGA